MENPIPFVHLHCLIEIARLPHTLSHETHSSVNKDKYLDVKKNTFYFKAYRGFILFFREKLRLCEKSNFIWIRCEHRTSLQPLYIDWLNVNINIGNWNTVLIYKKVILTVKKWRNTYTIHCQSELSTTTCIS